MDHPESVDDTPPPKAAQRELQFEDPEYLSADDIEAAEKELARRRRRLSSSDRRKVKKAAKVSRYPVERCVIASDWAEQRFAPFAMTRKRSDDKVAFGSGILDLGCQGLKSGLFEPGMARRRADEMIQRVESLGADFEEARADVVEKVLRHSVAYGHRFGFEPPSVYFSLSKFFGDTDLESVDVDVPLGHRGQPVLVPGPKDDVEELAEQLEEAVGRNGFYLGAPTADDADADQDQEETRARAPTPDQQEAPAADAGDDSDDTDIIMPGDL